MFPIPANATRIRYLESTGTQYVDTGISVADPSTIAIEIDETIGQPLGFTHQNNANGTWVARYAQSSIPGSLYIYHQKYTPRDIVSTTETRKLSKYDGASGYYENGVKIASFTAGVGSDSISGRNWLYGAVYDFNINGVDSRFSRSGKIYGLKIWVSGTLVRDYIPCRIGSVGYLFDRVSGQLFGNAGTGDFVLGPDTFQQGVMPTRMMPMGVRKKLPYDAEVEYIGVETLPATQYILVDEPYNALNDYSVEFSILRKKSGGRGGTVFGWLSGDPGTTASGKDLFPGLLYNYYGNQLRTCNNGSETGYSYKTSSLRYKVEFSGINVKVYEGGVLQYDKNVGSSRASFSCDYTPIFGLLRTDNNSVSKVGYIDSPGGFRLHSFAISRNGVTLRKLNPVRKGTTCYLYDRVSKQLFGNAGTGSFTLGLDK